MEGIKQLAFGQASKRLYALRGGGNTIFGFDASTPGTYTPLVGLFPLSVPFGGFSTDLAVDNTTLGSANNIYYVPESSSKVFGYDSSGTKLAGFPTGVGSDDICGAAVDAEGHIWLGDYSKSRIYEFEPSGGFSIGFIDTAAQGPSCHLAFDQSNDDMYVSRYFGSVWKYSAASNYTDTTVIDTGQGLGLAVDSSTHTIYVMHTGDVTAHTSTGTFLERFGTGIGASFQGIAVNEATSDVYLADSSGGGKILVMSGILAPDVTTGPPGGISKVTGVVSPAGAGTVTECYFEFGTTTSYGSKKDCSPAAPYSEEKNVSAVLPGLIGDTEYHYRLVAKNASGPNFGEDQTITPHYISNLHTDAATTITRTAAALHGSFEGTGNHTHYYFEWGPTTAYGSKSAVPPGDDAGVTTGPTALTFNASGLAAETEYHYRVVATNELGSGVGEDRTFTTLVPVQNVTTMTATDVTPKSATLNGSYLGDGDNTAYKYEYGLSTAYGSVTPPQSAGNPTGTTFLPFSLGGLANETTYHYRVVVTNSLGTTIGGDQSFTTTPAVSGLLSKPATEISRGSATVNGEFLGNEEDTHYYFEYGPTTAYGMQTPAAPGGDAGAPSGTMLLSAELADLEASTTYHYRVVATNGLGTTRSKDHAFWTLSALPPGIEGETASAISSDGATLEAQLNANRRKTAYWFEYGTTPSYGESTSISYLAGDDDVAHAVSLVVANLKPGIGYHFRAVASNIAGTTAGADRMFTTAAIPGIGAAASFPASGGSAHVSAVVNPNSSTTTVRFEYGTSRGYGQESEQSVIGPDTVGHEVDVVLSGLYPGTTYHVRVVATNEVGMNVGGDETFTTPPGPTPATRPRKCKRGLVVRRGKCVSRQHRNHRKHKGS